MLQLRGDLHWDHDAFLRLIACMQAYLESDRDVENLPRWVAEGFWFLDHFVRQWTSHTDFPRTSTHEYYEAAHQRLHDLAWWLFMGSSPQQSGTLETFDA